MSKPKRVEQAPKKRLAYRFFNNCGTDIVLIDIEQHAEYWDRVYRALRAKTWDEFRKLMPRDEYSRIVHELDEMADEEGEPRCKRSGPFSALCIPGYSDGDYPPFASAALHQFIPVDVLQKYGSRELSMTTGPFWQVPAATWPKMKQELEERGYKLAQRNDLGYLQ